MKPAAAKEQLERLLASRGLALKRLTPRAGVEAMLQFYERERAEGCEVEADGDMLLFQQGTHDWGEGEHFELDLTRQLTWTQSPDEDPEPWHLSLTFRFPPTDALRALGGSDRWCWSPAEIEAFRSFVESAPAFLAVADATDGAADLRWESAE